MNQPQPASPCFIQLEKLTKTYAGAVPVEALKGIDLQIMAGDRLALLGKSGSGKSTLLNLLALIDKPSSGRLLIDSQEASSFSEKNATLYRRHDIGFIFQFFNLLPTLTLAENISLPLALLGRREGQLLADLCQAAGISDKLHRYPEEVSGGEQQRAAVIRALVKKPRLILADEPTGNLDLETGLNIVALMNHICKTFGTTLIMVTHSSEAAAVCSRRLHIIDGHLQNDV
ncbi:MAG: ABC transporter ATP-binding protein [Deltaproteobacteria bacterium]|nr:ABC transporter ATP-binding protein [Candidatus Anaeroferrophillus wilburensis]MBN2889907.1 ABC transporter ATP-binding protein [Deltaproteobacteria bacterium]